MAPRTGTPARRSARQASQGGSTPAPENRNGNRQSLEPPGNSDNLGLPSVQGAGSVSYGSPGQADLPQMLVHTTRMTLAETIDAELSTAEHLAASVTNDVDYGQSPAPSTRPRSRSQSVETQQSKTSQTSNRGRGRGNAGNRGLAGNNLTSVEEEQEHDSSVTTGGAGASTTNKDPTASFIRERGTHHTDLRYTANEANAANTNAATGATPPTYVQEDQPFNFRHHLPYTKFYLGALLLFLLLIVLASNLGTIAGKVGRVSHSIPLWSRLSSKYCFEYNPYAWINDTDTARMLQTKVDITLNLQRELAHEILAQQRNLQKYGQDTHETVGKIFHNMGEIKDIHADTAAGIGTLGNGLLNQYGRMQTVEDKISTIESILRHVNLSRISPNEWYFNEINHFAPLNGAVNVPSLTSKTFKHQESWFKGVVRQHIGYYLPGQPVEALTRFDGPGECWCGDTKERSRGWTQFGVSIANYIYPTSIVIDHLPKRASLRPGTMPKNIELWAHMPSEHGREIIRSTEPYASLNPQNSPLFGDDHMLGSGWLLVRNLTYDSDHELHVQHFTIPMWPRFDTTGVRDFVVRAVSNYGSKDHTCFYRVIMRGALKDPVEE